MGAHYNYVYSLNIRCCIFFLHISCLDADCNEQGVYHCSDDCAHGDRDDYSYILQYPDNDRDDNHGYDH